MCDAFSARVVESAFPGRRLDRLVPNAATCRVLMRDESGDESSVDVSFLERESYDAERRRSATRYRVDDIADLGQAAFAERERGDGGLLVRVVVRLADLVFEVSGWSLREHRETGLVAIARQLVRHREGE